MPERLRATRAGLMLALAYTLPLLAWLAAQAILSSTGQHDLASPLQGMTSTLPLLQSACLALCLPWLMRFQAMADRGCAVMMFLLVPAPLYAIATMAGAVTATAVFITMAGLAMFATVLYWIYAICFSLTAGGQVRSLLLVGTQLMLVGLCWQYRHLWQQVVSP